VTELINALFCSGLIFDSLSFPKLPMVVEVYKIAATEALRDGWRVDLHRIQPSLRKEIAVGP
jgi:hypothetical protein